jgi:hypothetical protein
MKWDRRITGIFDLRQWAKAVGGVNRMRNLRNPSWAIGFASAALMVSPVLAMEPDQLDPGYTLNMTPGTAHIGFGDGAGGVLGSRANGSLLGIDTIPNFSSYFYNPGVDSFGGPQFTWQYTMVGKSPFNRGDDDDSGHVTRINAPVVPVTMDLRNADGSPRFVNGQRLISSPAAFVAPTLASPIFQPAPYTSSFTPTQFTDAVQRAEFYGVADQHWHTLLSPSVKPGRTMILKQGTYRFALNADGTCCKFVLVDINTFDAALFPSAPGDTNSVMGQSEVAGDVITRDISTFLFPNTFLYFNNDPNQCCVIGFHTYDAEPGDQSNGFKERRYVMNYSSWISPGIFRDPTFADVVALSHELAETFNDPFVNNATPWWLSQNGNCQNNLETGDVIEGLPGANKTIFLGGVPYHVQNEALLQWFAAQSPSTAIYGQYSYPDPVLNSAAVSQRAGCQ